MSTTSVISDLPSFFQVRVAWASRHQWPVGETLTQTTLGPCSFWLMEEGELQIQSGDIEWTLGQGDCLLWPSGRERTIVAGAKSTFGASWLSLGLMSQLFGHLDIMALLPMPHQWHPHDAVSEQLRALMENIALTSGDAAAKVLLRDGYCRVVIGLLWQMLHEQDLLIAAAETLPEWLQKVLAFAQKHPGASVADLTQFAAFSPAQFRRSFAHWMQVSPRQYLQDQRLEAARRLLEYTELPISSIAETLHFSNVTHFGKVWKKHHGVSPATYRRAIRLPQNNM